MTTIIGNWFAYELAGLWPLIWHFGIGGVLLLICGVGWYFSPVHKVDFIWAAVVIIVVMVSTSIGVSLGEKRIRAQWSAAEFATLSGAKEARAGAVRDVAREHSRWLPDKRDPDLRD
jgi:hypothetical protein